MTPRRWKKLVPTATLTAVAFTATSPTASALFPPIWPRPQTPTVIVPPDEPGGVIVVPPVDTGGGTIVPPPPEPPPPPPPPPPHPTGVPEPSTLVTGMAGLAAAAGWAARKRKKAGGAGDEGK
ncbi:MAG: PEP-CTERM sorting domain-containing protein [Gemmataceae bacterium]|nr:PEP-CTERM sorting domain-containing protein [Gemmataceae bacterium]